MPVFNGSCTTARPLRRAARLLVATTGCLTIATTTPPAGAQGTSGDSARLAGVVAQLIKLAQPANQAVRAARAIVGATAAQRAATGFAPPVAIQSTLTDAPRGDFAAGNGQIEAGRELFLGSRLAAARTRADGEVRAAEAELDAQLHALDVQVVRTLAHAVAASRVERRLERSDALLAATEDALRARFAAGDARYVDVLRVRTERLQTRAERSGVVADGAAARVALLLLLGGSADAAPLEALIGIASNDSLSAAWTGLVSTGIATDSFVRRFPEVRRAAADADRAQAGVVELLAAQRPLVGGAVGLQRIGVANGGPSLGLTLGLSSSLPFTARAANAAGRVAADRWVAAARAGQTAALASAAATIRAERTRYDAALERLRGFDTALLDAAETEREAAAAQYRAGTLTLLDLLDFERALLRVEIARARALTDAADSRAALFGIGAIDGPSR